MSSSSPNPTPERLEDLPVDEGSCLLRSYALNRIPRNDGEVVVLSYSQDPERGKGGADGPGICGKKVALPESLLYTPQDPITINGDYAHTSQKLYSTIWIMHRIGCDIGEATKLVNAVIGDQSSAKDVLHADSLDKFGNFITGVSLRAYSSPESFTIFVSLPYLGTARGDATPNESRTLRQYRLRQSINSPVIPITPPQIPGIPSASAIPASSAIPTSSTIMVHQTWLLSFNDEQIGIFRSKDDPYSDRAPLFPHQRRLAASQALVHIISNLLTSSENEAVNSFRSEINDLELKLEDNTANNRAELLNSYSNYIKDVSTMIRIVRCQIGYLDDLRHIFENSYDSKRLPEKHRPHRNSYPIPLLSKQAEQVEDMVTGIAAVVAERERFYKELRVMSKDLQLTRTLWLENNQTESQNAIADAMHAQAEIQLKMEESMKSQDEVVFIFSLTTTIFLPLGFFCSYYAMPGDLQGVTYWAVAGPITAIITLVLCFYVFVDDDMIKQWLIEQWWLQRYLPLRQPLAGVTRSSV